MFETATRHVNREAAIPAGSDHEFACVPVVALR